MRASCLQAALLLLAGRESRGQPSVIANGDNLELEVPAGSDVSVVYRGPDGRVSDRVSVAALAAEASSLRAELAAARADTTTLEARVGDVAGSCEEGRSAATAAQSVAAAAQSTATAAAAAAAAAATSTGDEDAVTTAIADALGPLQATIAALHANSTCQAALATALPANTRAIPTMCETGEGATCVIGCLPNFVSTQATNVALNKSARVTGVPFLRESQQESEFQPSAITDGVAPTGDHSMDVSRNRWLAWCDSNTGSGLATGRSPRANRPCVVTIDLEQQYQIDEIEYVLSMDMLVCGHSAAIWTGPADAGIDAVHSSMDDANWNTIVESRRPMSSNVADDFPQVLARFVRMTFDLSNNGRPCANGGWVGMQGLLFGLIRLSEIEIVASATASIRCRDGVWTNPPDNYACVPRLP